MNKYLLLCLVGSVSFLSGIERQASAQPSKTVTVHVRDQQGDLEVMVRPWRVTINRNADAQRLVWRLQSVPQGLITSISINNSRKQTGDCPQLPTVQVDGNTVTAGPFTGGTNNAWCGYNIVLTLAENDTITIDPEYKVVPGGPPLIP